MFFKRRNKKAGKVKKDESTDSKTDDVKEDKPKKEVHMASLAKDEGNLIDSNGKDAGGDDDDDDPDAHLKDIKNLKKGGPTSPTDMRGNLDRYDEFTSYHNRSERSHAHPDREPSKEEMALRKVQLKEELTIHKHEGAGITEEELRAYFMQEEDFKRCDADVELTSFRWEKHKKGKMAFDDEENTLRGLEDVIIYDQKREHARNKHIQDVMTEMMKQRAKGKKELDWDKIRHAALKTSEASQERAHAIGLQDAKDAREGLRASKRFGSFKTSNNRGSGSEHNRKSVGKMRMMLSFRGGGKSDKGKHS